MRAAPLALTLVAAAVLAGPLGASAPPVGPLPLGPVVTMTVPRGALFAIALPSRPASTGLVWRAAGGVNPSVPGIVRPLWESDVGASVAVIYKAVSAGKATIRYGLTRGETLKAYASITYRVTVVAPRKTASAGTSLASFRTPSGFIRCTYASAPLGFLRCDARHAYAPAPPAPAGCRVQRLNWADAFWLHPSGRASAYCHGDTAFGRMPPPVLAYGQAWSRDGVTCRSRRSGLTCTNRVGHGFLLTDASWRTF